MGATNALAYSELLLITTVKSFIAVTFMLRGKSKKDGLSKNGAGQFHKLFSVVIYNCSKTSCH